MLYGGRVISPLSLHWRRKGDVGALWSGSCGFKFQPEPLQAVQTGAVIHPPQRLRSSSEHRNSLHLLEVGVGGNLILHEKTYKNTCAHLEEALRWQQQQR